MDVAQWMLSEMGPPWAQWMQTLMIVLFGVMTILSSSQHVNAACLHSFLHAITNHNPIHEQQSFRLNCISN